MLSDEIGGGVIRDDVKRAVEAEIQRRLDGTNGTGALSAKYRELLLLSIAATRLNACLSELHARRAVRLGATPEEVRDAALTVILTGMIRWKMAGMGAFVAAAEAAGAPATPPDEGEVQGMRDYVRKVLNREFPDMWETLAAAAPGVLEGYMKLRAHILRPDARDGALPKWMLELIVTSCDVVQANAWGAEMHARQAIRDGATPEQVLDAIALVMVEAGVPAYRTGGRDVIEAAEDEARRRPASR
ncbi:MAG TPA: carboxymuconolactone decarboxylase family protein [Thermodesulfobacteriota bacterium]